MSALQHEAMSSQEIFTAFLASQLRRNPPVAEEPAVGTESENGDRVPGTPVEIASNTVRIAKWWWTWPVPGPSKKCHKQLQCRGCHNVVTLLYRNWDMAKLEGL